MNRQNVWVLGRPFSFLLRVLRSFKRNKGLLSGALAYYTLLSIVPMLILALIAMAVVALLSIEVVALILLSGAQVIAELERKPDMRKDNVK